MATTHFPLGRVRWAQALPIVVAGSAVSSVIAWTRHATPTAAAALVPGVLAVVLGAREQRRREDEERDRADSPPRFHPARHDLRLGVLQRGAFEQRLHRPDGWTAVAMMLSDTALNHAWVERVVKAAPDGVEMGLLGDGRLGVLFDARAVVTEAVAKMRSAAGPTVRVGLSIGGVGSDAVEALRAAEGLCRLAPVPPSAMHPSPARRLDIVDLEADLRHAIQDGALEVRFQPVIDLTRGTVRSMEALARWTHAIDGPIPPDVFIPIAERSGSIQPLTELVLGRALDARAK